MLYNKIDRPCSRQLSSVDPIPQEGDRSNSYTHRRIDRSHAPRHAVVDLSRLIYLAQMISQPFDLLGANRLDRTTANRIEPKSTPELFRPIFSHCLGYAVFTVLHCFLREKRSNLCYSQFGEDF
ncbi:unnamed protein product [Microthlaspi erraticum]|uniref:Uncharacterized protein n=1 Tax=Microthlaspi erraticum TaxID=1685480 RepID=A0A6D2K326_9BRAS|nr:unnamed protein product [Microthlaspi erraticum]